MNPYPDWQTEDDGAPLDYRSVHSVSEGNRILRGQKIHTKPSAFAVDEYGIPENPFNPPPQSQQPPRRRRSEVRPLPVMQPESAPMAQPMQAQAVQPMQASAPQPVQQPPVLQTADGSQYEMPAAVEIPDWLRVARQNNPSMRERHGTPQVVAAPKQLETDMLGRPIRASRSAVSPYEQAGYPPQLVEAQRQWETQQAAQPMYRRHGAQYGRNPSQVQQRSRAPQPMEPVQSVYLPPVQQEPWQVEEDEPVAREAPTWLQRVPWLGILAFVLSAVAIVFWVMGMTYEKRITTVLQGRAAQESALYETYPLQYRDLICEKADKYNLHPAFVAAIMKNESSFRPDATSNVGARGLMQLMDETAGWIYERKGDTHGYDFSQMYEPEPNAEYGCWYLNYLSERFRGDPILVAAAFHAGQGEVQNWLNDSRYSSDHLTIALERMIDGPTKQYVTRVLKAYAAYKRLYFGG